MRRHQPLPKQTTLKFLRSLTANSRKSYGFIAALVVLSLTAIIPLTTNAQTTYIWNVNSSGNWQTSANWSPSGIPGASDIAEISGNTSATTFGIDFSGATGSGNNNGANGQIVGEIWLAGSAGRTIGASTSTSGTLTLAGVSSGSGTTLLENSSGYTLALVPNVNSATGTMTVALGQSGNIDIENNGSITISANITDSGSNYSLTKIGTGSGTLTLSGYNSYSGGTVISGGILGITNGNALSTGTLTIGSGGEFLVSNTAAMTVTNNIVLSGSGTDTLSKTTSGTSAGTQVTFSGNISGGGTSTVLYLNPATQYDNTTNFNFAGNNTFVVSEINLNRGTITVSSATGLGATTNLLYLDSYANTTTGELVFGNNMTFAYNTQLGYTAVGINTNGYNVNMSGVVSGNQGLYKLGTGALTLSGSNTFSGASTVSAGTLITANSAALGTGAMTVIGGTLQVGDGVNNALTGIGALTINGGVLDLKTNTGSISLASGKNFSLTLGTWMLNGNSTTTGAGIDQITLSGGTYALTSGTVDLSGFTAGAGTYNIINGTGTVGALTFINGQAGYTYSFDTNGDLIIAVPEPSTITLTIIFGAGMLLLFRRRFGNRGSR